MALYRTLHILALAAGLVAGGCSNAASTATPGDATAPAATKTAAAQPAADASSTESQLQQKIGDAACTSDSQCHTIGWGAKACGGPERWVAWSSTNATAADLQQLADRHASERRAEHQRKGMVSTCNMVPDPGARCVAQRCQLNNATTPVAQ